MWGLSCFKAMRSKPSGFGKRFPTLYGYCQFILFRSDPLTICLIPSLSLLLWLTIHLLGYPILVDGGFSQWTKWSNCNVECGNGTQERRRSCNSPRPWFDGKPCVGSNKEERPCSSHAECQKRGKTLLKFDFFFFTYITFLSHLVSGHRG